MTFTIGFPDKTLQPLRGPQNAIKELSIRSVYNSINPTLILQHPMGASFSFLFFSLPFFYKKKWATKVAESSARSHQAPLDYKSYISALPLGDIFLAIFLFSKNNHFH